MHYALSVRLSFCLLVAGAALASSLFPSNSASVYLFVSKVFYLTWKLNSLVDFDEILQAGPASAVVVCVRKLAPRSLYIATVLQTF